MNHLPNFRFEIIRSLINAVVEGKSTSQRNLSEQISGSLTSIHAALAALVDSRLVTKDDIGHYRLRPFDICVDTLGRLQAHPPALRLRFSESATQPIPAHQLLQRAHALHEAANDVHWPHTYVSGVGAAHESGHPFDLMGTPRLDLTIFVSSSPASFDTAFLQLLHPELTFDPSPLESAPVVATLVHSPEIPSHSGAATPADIYLAMIDIGLKGQACEYLRGAASDYSIDLTAWHRGSLSSELDYP